MAKPPALFRYSGNKSKIITLLRSPGSYQRAVEPYLGSGRFILSTDKPSLGMDINKDVIDLWTWLRDEATPERLKELAVIAKEAVANTPDQKPDVRTLNLNRGETLYLRVNITGVYTGQLSSWKIYPKHNLPLDQTISLLPRLKNVELQNADASSYVEKDGDFVFIDPPYVATKANYKQGGKNGIEEIYKPEQTVALIKRLSCPVIFTYGTDAPTAFPEFDWEVVLRKKVPNIRRGGTVDRTEHVAYINWKS